MNEIGPSNPEYEIVVPKENRENRAMRKKNRFVFRNKRMRPEKFEAENAASDVILDDTVLNLQENKKKTGSHRLSELHSFRSKFR
ncbi:MAG: hypothetical protein ABFR82_16480 [Nitrospirota bacterium]